MVPGPGEYDRDLIAMNQVSSTRVAFMPSIMAQKRPRQDETPLVYLPGRFGRLAPLAENSRAIRSCRSRKTSRAASSSRSKAAIGSTQCIRKYGPTGGNNEMWRQVSRPSFPSSAWERTSAKLRFASPRDDFVYIRRLSGKQSFPDVRSQAELGNEAMRRQVRKLAATVRLGTKDPVRYTRRALRQEVAGETCQFESVRRPKEWEPWP